MAMLSTPLPKQNCSVSVLGSSEEEIPQQIPTSMPHQQRQQSLKKTSDGEISIFGAEKYFNEGAHHETKIPRMKNNQEERPRDICLPGTPSVISDSSYSSQNTLLHQNPPRAKDPQQRRRRFLANLRCRCYCSEIDEPELEPSSQSTIDSTPQKSNINDIPRNHKSVIAREVFGSPLEFQSQHGKNRVLSFERRLNVFGWDATTLKKTTFAATSNDEDSESDGSSDLFEIESLSTGHGKNNGTLSEDATCYAPSEASIAWSVVTASAAATENEESSTRNGGISFKGRHSGGTSSSSGFLGCKSQKALNVVERTNSVPITYQKNRVVQGPHKNMITDRYGCY